MTKTSYSECYHFWVINTESLVWFVAEETPTHLSTALESAGLISIQNWPKGHMAREATWLPSPSHFLFQFRFQFRDLKADKNSGGKWIDRDGCLPPVCCLRWLPQQDSQMWQSWKEYSTNYFSSGLLLEMARPHSASTRESQLSPLMTIN